MSNTATILRAATDDDHQALTGSLFVVVVLITVAITFWASRHNKTAADYYAGGREFTGVQNGFAVAGDYMAGLDPAWAFLVVAGIYLVLTILAIILGIVLLKKIRAPERTIATAKEIPAALKGRTS